MTQHTHISLHPNEYVQRLLYYPFAVNLDRCVGSCNTLNDLSNIVCVLNKTKDLNVILFHMITGINELKIITKHASCKWECKFDSRKYYLNQNLNNNRCWCKCKNIKKTSYVRERLYFEFCYM